MPVQAAPDRTTDSQMLDFLLTMLGQVETTLDRVESQQIRAEPQLANKEAFDALNARVTALKLDLDVLLMVRPLDCLEKDTLATALRAYEHDHGPCWTSIPRVIVKLREYLRTNVGTLMERFQRAPSAAADVNTFMTRIISERLRMVEELLCAYAAEVDGSNAGEIPQQGRAAGQGRLRKIWLNSRTTKAWFDMYPAVELPTKVAEIKTFIQSEDNLTVPRLVWRVAAGQLTQGLTAPEGCWSLAFTYVTWLRMRNQGDGTPASAKVVSQVVTSLVTVYTNAQRAFDHFVMPMPETGRSRALDPIPVPGVIQAAPAAQPEVAAAAPLPAAPATDGDARASESGIVANPGAGSPASGGRIVTRSGVAVGRTTTSPAIVGRGGASPAGRIHGRSSASASGVRRDSPSSSADEEANQRGGARRRTGDDA